MIVPTVVLGVLILFAVVGAAFGWVLVLMCLLWCFAQVSAARTLWAVGAREARRRTAAA